MKETLKLIKCRLNRIYNSSFPGATLYDLKSDSVKRLLNSWSVSVRHMWELPYSAHKYLVEPLSGDHAFKMLVIRHVKFLQSIRGSSKLAAQLMLSKTIQNVNTTTGKNVQFIQGVIGENQNLFKVSGNWLKKIIDFYKMDQNDHWKVDLIREIANIKQGVLCLDDANDNFFTMDDFKTIIDFVSTS